MFKMSPLLRSPSLRSAILGHCATNRSTAASMHPTRAEIPEEASRGQRRPIPEVWSSIEDTKAEATLRDVYW